MNENRILIVEDDPKLANAYAESLRMAGQCRIVKKGIEVLREFLNFKPQVMVLDIILEGEKDYTPTAAGIEILREIRNNKDAICRNAKVIVVTGRIEPEIEKKCRQLGISEFFLKPTDHPAQILVAVRNALREYRNQCCTVFVSSAMGELQAERHVVSEAIEDLDKEASCIAVDMAEKWGANPRPVEELYLEAVRRCDVFILLLGAKYGELIPGKVVSAVENEYNMARASRKNITVFIKAITTPRDPRMEAFIARIQDQGTGQLSREFSNLGELRRLVQESQNSLCDARRREGACLKRLPPGMSSVKC